MPDEIQAKIDEMKEPYMPSEFDSVSFTSPKNADTQFVQFILKCDGIELQEEATKSEAPTEEETFLDRLAALFP
jgi:hypothetical protein